MKVISSYIALALLASTTALAAVIVPGPSFEPRNSSHSNKRIVRRDLHRRTETTRSTEAAAVAEDTHLHRLNRRKETAKKGESTSGGSSSSKNGQNRKSAPNMGSKKSSGSNTNGSTNGRGGNQHTNGKKKAPGKLNPDPMPQPQPQPQPVVQTWTRAAPGTCGNHNCSLRQNGADYCYTVGCARSCPAAGYCVDA